MIITVHTQGIFVAMGTDAGLACTAKVHHLQFYSGLDWRQNYSIFECGCLEMYACRTAFIQDRNILQHTSTLFTYTALISHTQKLCHSLSFHSHFLQCPCHRYDTPVIALPIISCQTAFWLMCISASWKLCTLDIDSQTEHRSANITASCWQKLFLNTK